jgi:hypothetical protein
MTCPHSVVSERRARRSDFPYEAANLFLQSVQRRAGLHGLALGDDDGLVIAGAGKPADVERLAIWGALSAADQGDWRDQVDAYGPGRPFFSLRLAIGPTNLRLSGLGIAEEHRSDIEQGLARILGGRLGRAAS